MERAHLLLVDDSEAILEFERSALSPDYELSAARDGEEALEKIRARRPDCVLLDLSMPRLDGDELLSVLKRDPGLSDIPVIIVSSEQRRGEACVRVGASAYLPKPVDTAALSALVERVLSEVRRPELVVLPLSLGPISLALPLPCVRLVLAQVATLPLPLGPPYLCELFELYGRPVAVLDLARRLGVEHAKPRVDRRLVVISLEAGALALCVDEVRDPEAIAGAAFTRREELGAGARAPLGRGLLGVAKTQAGPLPVIEPSSLLSPRLLRRLSAALGGLP